MELSDLEKYDSKKMYQIYDDWPELAKAAYSTNLESIEITGKIDHIVFAGMGGSGAVGDLFAAILSKSNIHVTLVKGYLLPKTVDSSTLVITTSVSGNTMETLTVLKSASKLNCHTVAFSSGGVMETFCKNNSIPFRKIPQIHSPRASFVTFVYSILAVLQKIIPISDIDVNHSILSLNQMHEKINSTNLTDTNPALSLSQWISGIPLVYYPHGLQSAAIRLKSSLQENSKTHCIAEDVIEACHNGVVAWERDSVVQPILLQGVDDYTKTKQRFEIISAYFDEKNIPYYSINSGTGNILSKLISLIYLFDYSTIYRAILLQVDPSPVKPIDYIKNKL